MRLIMEIGIEDFLRIFGIKKVNEKFYESLKSSETLRLRATMKKNGFMTNHQIIKKDMFFST